MGAYMRASKLRDNQSRFSGTYDISDVEFLLKPIILETLNVVEKERRIQEGSSHYSEMLSPESAPDAAYMRIYEAALEANADKLAGHINQIADSFIKKDWAKAGNHLALVSLARAGTPIGILITRALRRRGIKVTHYAVSIIRGRGIDLNAMRYILDRHTSQDVVFVDGWTGKGAIAGELRGPRGPGSLGIDPLLIVVADPAGVADLAATSDDYVIPSGILNGIVSGLVSRSVLNNQIGENDFHGCVMLDHLKERDVSGQFIETIDALADKFVNRLDLECGKQISWSPAMTSVLKIDCEQMLSFVQSYYKVKDINRIKPGIAEATRAVLRRLPERLLIRDIDDEDVRHLVLLANQKGVAIETLPNRSNYRAVAIIAEIGGD